MGRIVSGPETLGFSGRILRVRGVGDLRFEAVMASRVLNSATAVCELSWSDHVLVGLSGKLAVPKRRYRMFGAKTPNGHSGVRIWGAELFQLVHQIGT